MVILVIVGTRTDAEFLRSQEGMASESDGLFGQFERIFCISDSEAGVKVEKSGVVEGEGMCGDDVVSSKRQTKCRYFLLVKK